MHFSSQRWFSLLVGRIAYTSVRDRTDGGCFLAVRQYARPVVGSVLLFYFMKRNFASLPSPALLMLVERFFQEAGYFHKSVLSAGPGPGSADHPLEGLIIQQNGWCIVGDDVLPGGGLVVAAPVHCLPYRPSASCPWASSASCTVPPGGQAPCSCPLLVPTILALF